MNLRQIKQPIVLVALLPLALSVACTASTPPVGAKVDARAKADGPDWGSGPESVCSDTCHWSGDGECDDGRPGSDYSVCDPGTDCADCGDWVSWECPPTGLPCSLECDGGTLPGTDVPCQRGVWDPASCECAAGDVCAPTGLLCTMECADGAVPGTGAPCVQGVWNESSCVCEAETACMPTGLPCTMDCVDGAVPGTGAPCTRGEWNPTECTCDAADECAPSGLLCAPECVDGTLPGTSVPCQAGAWNSSSCACEAACTNFCRYAFDGECDDGSPGADYSLCPLGSDCADCSS